MLIYIHLWGYNGIIYEFCGTSLTAVEPQNIIKLYFKWKLIFKSCAEILPNE